MRWKQALARTGVARERIPKMKAPTGSTKTKVRVSKETKGVDTPSHLITARIKELGDWRGEALARIRAIIKKADPDVVETWK